MTGSSKKFLLDFPKSFLFLFCLFVCLETTLKISVPWNKWLNQKGKSQMRMAKKVKTICSTQKIIQRDFTWLCNGTEKTIRRWILFHFGTGALGVTIFTMIMGYVNSYVKKKFAVLFKKKISDLMPCNFCLLKSNDKRREEKVKRVFCLKWQVD